MLTASGGQSMSATSSMALAALRASACSSPDDIRRAVKNIQSAALGSNFPGHKKLKSTHTPRHRPATSDSQGIERSISCDYSRIVVPGRSMGPLYQRS